MPDPTTPPATPPDLAEHCRKAAKAIGLEDSETTRGLACFFLTEAADELDRLQGEVKQLGIEKDALVRAATDRLCLVEQRHRDLVATVDRHVAASVWEDLGFLAGSTWTHGRTGQRFPTRAEAEAAYRAKTGLETEDERKVD